MGETSNMQNAIMLLFVIDINVPHIGQVGLQTTDVLLTTGETIKVSNLTLATAYLLDDLKHLN